MKKMLVILSACLLLVFVSGCSQQPPPQPQEAQPDQDLSEEELNSMYDLVFLGGDFGASFNIYFNKFLYYVNTDTSPNVLKDRNLVSKKKVEKITVEPTWSGPDDHGWYTKTKIEEDTNNTTLTKLRYFSSLKRLEYEEVYTYSYSGSTDTQSGYMILNKDIRQDITHAYPVSAEMYYTIPTFSNKDITIRAKFVFENMNLVYLDQIDMYAWIGSIKIYGIYINYDENIEVEDKLMVEATSEVGADGESIDISGRCDDDGIIYTDDGYRNFSRNISLSEE